MPITPAYHTNRDDYGPEQKRVYHNKSNCPDGKRIKAEHRTSGTDGRRLCLECPKVA